MSGRQLLPSLVHLLYTQLQFFVYCLLFNRLAPEDPHPKKRDFLPLQWFTALSHLGALQAPPNRCYDNRVPVQFGIAWNLVHLVGLLSFHHASFLFIHLLVIPKVLMAFFSARSTPSVPRSWTIFLVRPVRLLCSLRTVMTCALPALVLTISGRCFRIMPALTAAFCPERCVWPGCPRRSSLLTGRSLSSRICCRLDKPRPRRRGSAADVPLASGRKAKQRGPTGLSTRVDQLSTALAQMKALLQSLRVRGSGASQEGAGEPVSAAIRTALGRLQLDVPPAQSAPSSAFFRRPDADAAFVIPPSAEYVQELHACWTDTRAFSCPTTDGRALAAMLEATKFGLGCMPPVKSAIASLIVPPDEALRPNARCPRPQCRVMDDLLCRAYDSGAQMGWIGNSLSHLMLGLSSSLESVPLDQSTQALLDASLQAFVLMTSELGCTLSTLVHARRQVWLAQSSLTEPCRRTLRALPVVPPHWRP
ncbi:hypothetical protein GOODEAATRI_010727 [Goodea atripinnis]|uniref:Uncharacterized protein n=1 Tax=Goodea atripinnis TaxID=208336 RepID=A0ABV0PMG0_9TELE